MDAADECRPGELATEVPQHEGDRQADREADEGQGVLAVRAKHLVRPQRAPEDGSSKEGVDTCLSITRVL